MDTKFKISKARISELEECIDCININFCQSEPISKALSLTEQEFHSFVKVFTERSIKNEHTAVIKNSDSKIIACIVSEDLANDLPCSMSDLHPKMAPVFAILGDLDKLKFKDDVIFKNKFFHILMVGVYPEYKGNNLAEKLIIFQEQQARSEGFKYSLAEATGPISQKIFLNLRYNTEHKIVYSQYSYKGEFIYKNVSECKSCDLVIKEFN